MWTEEVGKWLIFFVGVAALIPSAATLLRRRTTSVTYRVSVSVEANSEQFAERLKSLSHNELAIQFHDLLRTLEVQSERESNEVSRLLNEVIADLDRKYRRDLLFGMISWLVSALCSLGLLFQRSELSLILAFIWCGLIIVVLVWRGLDSVWMRSKTEERKQRGEG